MADKLEVIWVHSNRADDRTVLFERDPAHPGGEAFVGGDGGAKVAKTPEVMRLLREGLIVEIPEPPDSRKKPIDLPPGIPQRGPDQPGQAVRLGRVMDPEIVPEGAMKTVEAQQERAGDNIPVPAGVVVPEANAPVKETTRR